MSRPTTKVSPKSLKEDDQNSLRKARSPVDWPFWKPYWQSERRKGERGRKMCHNGEC